MSGYPTESEFGEYMVTERLLTAVPADGMLLDALNEAIEIWQKETGWIPFYTDPLDADTVQTVQWSQGSQSLIQLPVGILSLTSLVVDSVTMVLDTDYRLALKRIEGPYMAIEMIGWSGRGYNTLTVEATGKFGYTHDVPVGAKLGIFAIALSEGGVMDRYLGNFGYGPVTREKQGPVDISWSTSAMSDPIGLRAVYSGRAKKAISRYKWRTA